MFGVNFDIPDPKRKLFRDAWESFRRACNIQEAIFQMELQVQFMKDEKRKLFYTAALALLTKEREETIAFAIEKYQQHKNHGI